MEIFLTLVAAIALIPAVLFLYSQLSLLFQTIFNKNLDEEAHKTKWRLNTPSAYAMLTFTTLSFVNMFSFCSKPVDVVLSFCIIAASYAYLYSLIKHHGTELLKKLD